MEDLLVQTLETFGFPVFRQGSLSSEEAYPDYFFTFWNNDSSEATHYDNRAKCILWDFDVNFYSIDPKTTYNTLRSAIARLRIAGFIVPGCGYDVSTDEPTHTGRGVNALFREEL